MLVSSETATVIPRGSSSVLKEISLANLTNSTPTRNIMAPIMARGKEAKI